MGGDGSRRLCCHDEMDIDVSLGYRGIKGGHYVERELEYSLG